MDLMKLIAPATSLNKSDAISLVAVCHCFLNVMESTIVATTVTKITAHVIPITSSIAEQTIQGV